ncbi:Ig-like domain-containing protein [Pedobacter sp.]|uniref:Ig-like domain-containing protein n=1 Tax=Pedobacter sp. TaxID=1411316 RepID=UPI003D7FE3FF
MKKLILSILVITSLSLSSCKKEDASFKLSDTKLTLKVGERKQLSVTMAGDKQKVEHFTWYSSDVRVGDVNGSGQAFGIKKGNFTVKVEHDETSTVIGTCEVTVN